MTKAVQEPVAQRPGERRRSQSDGERRRTTSIYLKEETLTELDAAADALDRSRAWIIEAAVLGWLAERRAGREEEPVTTT